MDHNPCSLFDPMMPKTIIRSLLLLILLYMHIDGPQSQSALMSIVFPPTTQKIAVD